MDQADPDGYEASAPYSRTFGPDYPHRASVLQYRYHTSGVGQHPTAEPTATITGKNNQLKSEFRPEQLEYYAELLYRGNADMGGKSFTVRDAAFRLMLLPDSSLAVVRGGESYHVDELAAKIVGYEEDSGAGGRVATQYIQSGCGCGGGVQSTKETFTRHDTAGSVEAWKSTQVINWTNDGSTWGEYYTTWWDYKAVLLGGGVAQRTSFVPVYNVVKDNATGLVWIRENVYDEDARIVEVREPGLNKDLTYAPADTGVPTLTGSLSTPGVATYYVYNDANRVEETGVRTYTGSGSSDQAVVKVTYPLVDGTNLRTHLPTEIKRIARVDTGADNEERTTFTYSFYSSSSSNIGFTAVRSLQTSVESELLTENGPNTSTTYTNTVLMDPKGRPVFTISPTGTLTQLEYEDPGTSEPMGLTGEVWKTTVNAPSSVLGGFASDFGSFVVANSAGSLEYVTQRDALARIRRTIVPGPVSGGIVGEWVYANRQIDNASPADERQGVRYMTYIQMPPRLGDGTYSGPAMMAWVNAQEGSLAAVKVQQNTVSTESALPLNVITPITGGDAVALNDHVSGRLDEATILGSKKVWFTLSGLAKTVTGWHDVSGALGRDAGDRSLTETFTYDSMGRRLRAISAQGTITEDHYDIFGRLVERRYGTGGTLPVAAEFFYDWSGSGSPAQGVGNGNLMLSRGYAGEGPGSPAGLREKRYTYDLRDRLIAVQNPTAPHQWFGYDNLGRVTASAEYLVSPTFDGNRVLTLSANYRGSYVEQSYGQRGLVFRTRVAVDPSKPDEELTFLESHVWRDAAGRAIATWGPDRPATKVVYDGLGRVAKSYSTDRAGDPLPGASNTLAHANDVDGDTVLEQDEVKFTEWGAASIITHLVRRHDAPPAGATSEMTGALSATGTGTTVTTQATGIATYTGYLYDDVGRPIRTVAYGTNNAPGSNRLDDSFSNGTNPTTSWPLAQSATPSWNTTGWENQIITAVTYNTRGLLDTSIDPLGRKTKVIYDDLGRTIATIENFVSSGEPTVAWNSSQRWDVTPSATTPGENRVTSYAHFKVTESGSDHWIMRQVAHTASSGVQVTDTVFGVAQGSGTLNSLISSADWVKEVRYADETSGLTLGPSDGGYAQHRVAYAYNALGEMRSVIDQNQTTHQYSRDAMGRVIIDEATLGSGSDVDPTIKVITAQYDDMGRLRHTRSRPTLSGTVANHVLFSYDKLGRLTHLEQDADSEIGVSGRSSRVVMYAYRSQEYDPGKANGGNSARAESMSYPTVVSGGLTTTLAYNYGVSGGVGSLDQNLNDRIGRVSALTVHDAIGSNSAAVPVAEYSYVGLGMISNVDLGAADIQLDRTVDATGRRNYASIVSQNIGSYPGWDRFGRVKRQAWVPSGGWAAPYDWNGNTTTPLPFRMERVNLVYGYDNASNPIFKLNAQLDASTRWAWTGRDWEYAHDGLDRLTQSRRGVLSGAVTGGPSAPPTLTREAGSQAWAPDVMGNWSTFAVDLDNNGLFSAAETQTRHHNNANELQAGPSGTPAAVAQPSLASGVNAFLSAPLAVPFAYDHDDNGSRTKIDRVDPITHDGVSHKFVYDAWNRLVRIQKATVTDDAPGTYATTAEYAYNGLHWRTTKTSFTTPGGTTGKRRSFTYNAAWQCIIEEIDDDFGLTGELPTAHEGLDRVAQQFFGLRGINDALYRREDRYVYVAAHYTYPQHWDPILEDYVQDEPVYHAAVYTPLNGFFDNQAFYQLSDAQFSVVSVVAAESTMAGSTSGTVIADGASRPGPSQSYRVDRTIEINEYEPYGRSWRWKWADFNRNQYTTDDWPHYFNAYALNRQQADTNEDGGISGDDLTLWTGLFFGDDPTPADGLTSSVVDNPYGYCGYYADMETLGINGEGNGFLYHVRHRVYDPIAGRWLQRDPAGFVDGMNLYEYCGGGSVSCFDPMGLDKYEWHDYPGYKDGKKGTYHHKYRTSRSGWLLWTQVTQDELVETRFTADGEETDDLGQSEYQRTTGATIKTAASETRKVTENAVNGAGFVLAMAVPGPEEVVVVAGILAVRGAVSLVRYGRALYVMYKDGKTAALTAEELAAIEKAAAADAKAAEKAAKSKKDYDKKVPGQQYEEISEAQRKKNIENVEKSRQRDKQEIGEQGDVGTPKQCPSSDAEKPG